MTERLKIEESLSIEKGDALKKTGSQEDLEEGKETPEEIETLRG